ncbi:MAG TPA: hypothetical protein VK929_17025 [Longimicrobiales bacterium]|nr:hypothetical protein [Longimicrobiales bacterium]
MRRRIPTLCLVAAALAVLTASGCASTAVSQADVLPGCYYFEQTDVARSLNLPWGVELLEDSLEGWPAISQLPDVRQAVTLVGPAERAGFPFGYWRTVAEDSVEIGYPAGGGLVLALAVQPPATAGGLPAGLAGTARAVGDAVPFGDTAASRQRAADPVSLMRARCPE